MLFRSKNEIRSADIVVSTKKIQNIKLTYPNNVGFLLVFIDEEKYNYVTYYMKSGKLVRMAYETTSSTYPVSSNFAGHNEVCRFVEDISLSYLDTKNKMIHLDFKLKSQGKRPIYYRIKSDIYIRTRTDF